MSAEAHRPVNGDTGESPEDAALARVLESYLAGLEAGRPVDPDRLIAAHPELAGPLRACLKVMHLAAGLSDATGRTAGPIGAQPDGDGIPAPPAASALTVLWPHDDSSSHPALPEPPGDEIPVVRLGSDALPASPDGPGAGRYQVLGEIARGGMGVVLKARDVDLGRDLALKVLQERHRADPGVVGRFIEEARIGGQLQHPGIVPVHELGTLSDRRPYFTMKLVKGRTLSALLAERSSPGADLPRFLTVFEQVCQTVAYAHARRVIHRDLKPANVMVGSFGEVQVVDWGLAKVLPEGGVADEARAMAQETEISTARGGPPGSDGQSQPGSVLGTPSYMAPEQARGEVALIDERADVFGLGAILCEMLTGRQPFGGSIRDEIRAQSARGDLTSAFRRLDACGADAELIALARDCLAADPAQRPRNAVEVARRVSAYQAAVRDRLRAAELARVAAQTRAEEERKRRHMTVALAASILGLVFLGGAGWAYLSRQRAERLAATTRVVTEALAEAERFRGQAQEADGDLSKWASAVSAAKHARDLLAEGEADEALRSRVSASLADLEREEARAREQAAEMERDRQLLDELETIRVRMSEHWDGKRADAEFAAAFRGFGIDPDRVAPEQVGRQIARRSKPRELAAFLDDWAMVQVGLKKAEIHWRRLFAAALVADPDPWRAIVRGHIGRRDGAALRQLAEDRETLEAQPASSLRLLAAGLSGQGDLDRAEKVLRMARRPAPGDFWVNHALAETYTRLPGRLEEAARYAAICIAVRPGSGPAHALAGKVLRYQGRIDEAIGEYREMIRLMPDSAAAHATLGGVLYLQGKMDDAIAEFRAALRLDPTFYGVHINLGLTLRGQAKLDDAIDEFREAIRLMPDSVAAYTNLGMALGERGDYSEALGELRRARDLNLVTKNPEVSQQLGRLLLDTERLASLADRLPAFLSGQLKSGKIDEIIGFAQVCNHKKLYGTAARIWSEALVRDTKLAEDMHVLARYNAAMNAAMAGARRDEGPPLDELAKARWRKQAIEWLRADLTAWTRIVEIGPSEARSNISRFLRHWKANPDLAGLRDPASLDKLPRDEQDACRALWKDVDALLAKAVGHAP